MIAFWIFEECLISAVPEGRSGLVGLKWPDSDNFTTVDIAEI